MRRQDVAVAVVVAAVLLAGCAGTGGDGTATTPGGTDAGTATTGEGTGTTDEDPTTDDGIDRSAEEVRDDAVAAIGDVDTYRVVAEQEAVVSANLVRRSTQTSTVVFDREARELQADRTVRAAGRTQQVSTWLVDGTVYQRSDAFVQRFGAKWVELDVSANFSRYWRLQDTLTRQRAVLENASTLELAGTETVNGTEAVVLRANVSPGDYGDLVAGVLGASPGDGANVTVHRADFTFYLHPETDRPVRTEAQINATVLARGQEVGQNVSVTMDYYGYGEPASIDLPEAADSAVDLTNRTGGSRLATGEGAVATGDGGVGRPAP